MNSFHIRKIQPADDKYIAEIIRNTLAEFGADKPGTVYFDKTTDHLSEIFKKQGSVYFIAEMGQQIIGGGGIYPSDGLPENTCELVKMYLLPQARGKGIGAKLIQKCMAFAKNSGYSFCYLETMPELKKALEIYAHFGFQYLEAPMGNTGHFGCSLWMLKAL